jgi:hypothetical protein
MTICKPFVASVSSSELGEAVVVSVIEASAIDPAALLRSTLRWIVSPGAMPLAPMLSLFVEEPVAPSEIEIVPLEIVWLTAGVELVKVAKVPRPAMLAAETRRATESSSFGVFVMGRRILNM